MYSRVRISMSPLLEAAVDVRAREAEMTFSEYVRRVLLAHFRQIGYELKQEWGLNGGRL